MSEETDALNNRIRQLENQVADMQRLVQDTSDLLDIARANGLDKFLTGHGFLETQGGTTRFDTSGMQVKTDTDIQTAIWFLPAFTLSPGATTVPRATYQGLTNSSTGYAENYTDAAATATIYNVLDMLADEFGGSTTTITVRNTVTTQLVVQADATYRRVYLNGAFQLGQGTSSNISPTLSDGMLWYEATLDKAQLRANGVTENLATESYVAANAPTGFADHFLVMGG